MFETMQNCVWDALTLLREGLTSVGQLFLSADPQVQSLVVALIAGLVLWDSVGKRAFNFGRFLATNGFRVGRFGAKYGARGLGIAARGASYGAVGLSKAAGWAAKKLDREPVARSAMTPRQEELLEQLVALTQQNQSPDKAEEPFDKLVRVLEQARA